MLSTYIITWQTMFQAVLVRYRTKLDAAQAALDRLLLPAKMETGEVLEEGEKRDNTIWWVIGILGGLILLCVCLAFVFPTIIITILALLGPAIGNVFSNIMEEI